jgi:hypothetical protein
VTAATEAGRAAELIAFALQAKMARGADERYGELWSEYRSDEEFRDVVDAVANGLGLVVLAAADQGLIIAPMDRSVFSFRMADYQNGMDPKRRVLVGLVHLGIAAVAYPREADLEGDIVVRRRPEQVERFLREACGRLLETEERDPEAGEDAEEEMAWRTFLAMPSAKRTQKGRYSADCTLGQIIRAFEWLVAQGMARDAGGGVYQLLDRYRVQVREVAGQVALEQLRALAERTDFAGEAAAVTDAEGDGAGYDTNDDAGQTSETDLESIGGGTL